MDSVLGWTVQLRVERNQQVNRDFQREPRVDDDEQTEARGRTTKAVVKRGERGADATCSPSANACTSQATPVH
jgi:hypothetical protein